MLRVPLLLDQISPCSSSLEFMMVCFSPPRLCPRGKSHVSKPLWVQKGAALLLLCVGWNLHMGRDYVFQHDRAYVILSANSAALENFSDLLSNVTISRKLLRASSALACARLRCVSLSCSHYNRHKWYDTLTLLNKHQDVLQFKLINLQKSFYWDFMKLALI